MNFWFQSAEMKLNWNFGDHAKNPWLYNDTVVKLLTTEKELMQSNERKF
jgi:hypothetical protein